MTADEKAKNHLIDKTCETCTRQKSLTDRKCVRYLGEAFGWQWWPIPDENTCEDWKK